MRSILVPVADKPECAVALTYAFDLAERFSASVHGVHIRPHQKERKKGTHLIPFRLQSSADWRDFLSNDEVKLNSAAAKEFYLRLVEKRGFTFSDRARYKEGGKLAQWHEVKGDPEKVFSIIGPVSDMLVVSRPQTGASSKARAFQYAALLNSGRPVLMVPHNKPTTVGKRVLIAWNQSWECAEAVRAIMPILQAAESVCVLACGSEDRVGPKVAHLANYLKYWKVKIHKVRTNGRSPAEEVVSTYMDTQSDLLVMGAYSRSRIRELIFGGVTDHILNHTSLPVIMHHR